MKTVLVFTPIALAGLMMAACGDQTATPPADTAASDTAIAAPATTPPATSAVLGKVDLNQPLRILGTEPSWHADITPASVTLNAPGAAQQVFENKGPTLQGQTANWTTQTATGAAVMVTATLKDCSDQMSDRIYPLTATVKVGDTTYNGCAASLAALDAAGESGRVE